MTAKLERPGQHRLKDVDLGDGDVVTIKRLTAHDRSMINASSVTGKLIAKDKGEFEAGQLNVGAPAIQQMIQGIVAWRGPSFCVDVHEDDAPVDPGHSHTSLPVEPQYIIGLYDTYQEIILQALDEWAPNPPAANGKKN